MKYFDILNKWYFWVIILVPSLLSLVVMPSIFIIILLLVLGIFLIYYSVIWGLLKLKKDIFRRWYFWVIYIIFLVIELSLRLLYYGEISFTSVISVFLWTSIIFIISLGIGKLFKHKKH